MIKSTYYWPLLLILGSIACKGSTAEETVTSTVTTVTDGDGDGYDSDLDCDDADANSYPGADEICDQKDNDCDQVVDESAVDAPSWYSDFDGDGFGDMADPGVESCDSLPGKVLDNSDCDDSTTAVSPAADEFCDKVDTDCDEELDNDPVDGDPYYTDADGDGFGDDSTEVKSCDPIKELTADGGDCDDSDTSINPGAAEVCDDKIDQDCDGLVDDTCLDSSDVSSADVVLTGGEGNSFGYSLASGDFDGDGEGDLVVGAWSDHSVEYFGGSALLFSGASLKGSVKVEDAAGSVFGQVEYGNLGFNMSSVEDIDGDGSDELLVSSYGVGEVMLFNGPLGNEDWVAGATFTGDTDFGRLILTSGDLTDDGAVDVLIGGDGVDDAGAVYLFAGPFDGEYVATDAHLTIAGEEPEGDMGTSGVLADMDGDGADDLVLSVSAIGAGSANIFFGSNTGVVGPSDADLIIVGAEEGESFGALLAIGDADGDGTNDLAVSSPGDDTLATNGGAVHLFYGPELGVESADAGCTIYGTSYADNLGYQTGGLTLGDLNDDAKDDLVIGFYGDDSEYSNGGGAYVVYGSRTGSWTVMEADRRVTGSSEGAQVGRSILVSDLNGDTIGDLVVGSDRDAPELGAVWIFWGEAL